MTDSTPPGTMLVEAAQAIHADNLHLLDRLAAGDCDPGIELDNTLNGAAGELTEGTPCQYVGRNSQPVVRGSSEPRATGFAMGNGSRCQWQNIHETAYF